MYGTAEDVKRLTGITPERLGLKDDEELDVLLDVWLRRITAAINARLTQGEIKKDDPDYEGVVDVCVRTVAKLVAVAYQQRQSPIVQIEDFAVDILNTSQVTENLYQELRPYQKRRVSVFLSSNATG